MILYIVRHAWAEERDGERWPDDAQRPLTSKGIARFGRVAKRLVKRGVKPTVVVSSPLVRCVETAQILCDRLELRLPEFVDALAPGAQLANVLAATAKYDADEIAWVGHAPDVGRLVAELAGSEAATIEMAKGAAGALEFDGRIEAGRGRLVWLVTAKMLGA